MTPADLAEKITATVVPETVILEISATDPDPQRGPAHHPGLRRRADRVRRRARDAARQDERRHQGHRRRLRQPAHAPGLAAAAAQPRPGRRPRAAARPRARRDARAARHLASRDRDDIAEATDAPVLGGILFDSDATEAAPGHRPAAALPARRGVPDPAHQPAVRRRRQRQEGLRGHQLRARRGQDEHRQQHRPRHADDRPAHAAHRRRPAPPAARQAASTSRARSA